MPKPPRRRAPSAPPSIPLLAVLDLRAAAPLAAELLGRRGKSVVVDGSAVERLGGQCLQVLLAGRATWRADGHAFQIVDPSAAFSDALAALGAADLVSVIPGECMS
jgi:chemotaxis protein CheX